MAAVVADHALGPAGGAGRVEDVERVGGGDRHAVRRSRRRGRTASAQSRSRPGTRVAAHCGRCRITQRVGLVRRSVDRRVQQRLVGDHPARPRYRRRRRAITIGSASSMRTASSCAANPPNTTEWTAPSRAQASMREQRLGHHRHVQDHPVAPAHAEPGAAPRRTGPPSSRSSRYVIAALGTGDRAVVDRSPPGRRGPRRRAGRRRCGRCSARRPGTSGRRGRSPVRRPASAPGPSRRQGRVGPEPLRIAAGRRRRSRDSGPEGWRSSSARRFLAGRSPAARQITAFSRGREGGSRPSRPRIRKSDGLGRERRARSCTEPFPRRGERQRNPIREPPRSGSA